MIKDLYLKNNIYKDIIMDFLFTEYSIALQDTRKKYKDVTINSIDIEANSASIFRYLLVDNLFEIKTLYNIHNELYSYYKNNQNDFIIRLKQIEAKLNFFDKKSIIKKIKTQIINNIENYYIYYITLDSNITNKSDIENFKNKYIDEFNMLLYNPKTSYLFILIFINYFIDKKTIYNLIQNQI